MLNIGKKISWLIKRHPYLYYIRFKLLSKYASQDKLASYTYNLINDKRSIPKSFHIVNSIIFKNKTGLSSMEKALRIGRWLRTHIKGGSGLSLSSEKALEKMLAGKGGVCSDIAQVFNNFCVINDIKVREWGITSVPFSGEFGGHAFNEFYSKELNKWILIDVSNTIMFYLKGKAEKLSTLELFECNKTNAHITFKSFLKSNVVDKDRIKNYFLKSSNVPFLICNYNNETYDNYLDRFQPYLPIFMIHFWLFVIRKSYYYLFPFAYFKKNVAYDR